MKPTTLTYGGDLRDVGYAGQIVDSNPSVIDSKTNSAATAIDFGVPVARSTANDTCKAPATTADKVVGLSVRHAIRPADANGNVTYTQYDSVPILRSGFLYVTAKENAARGDFAHVVLADNTVGSSSAAGAIAAATSAAKSGGNTGNGTLTLDVSTPVRAGAKPGVYAVRCIAAATNSGTFEVTDPDGFVLSDQYVVGATFDNDIKFVIADGSSDFIVGDGFDITVDAGRIPLDGTNGNAKVVWETTTTAGNIGVVRITN